MTINANCKKINGNTLKLIACIIMLIDHLTAGIMIPVVREGLYQGSLSTEELNLIYKILRGVGRSAFPIFCFLLVEGFIYTGNRKKYAGSLLFFGIISEIFYDLTFKIKVDRFNLNIPLVLEENKDILFNACNVYFTLFIALLVIWGIEKIQEKFGPISAISAMAGLTPASSEGSFSLLSLILSGGIAAAGAVLAQYIHSDYRWYGVLLIVIFYLLRNYEPLNLLAGYLFIMNQSTEYWAFPAFILLLFYNKKRGKRLGRLKYLFYIFYPVHIAIIYLVRCIIYG